MRKMRKLLKKLNQWYNQYPHTEELDLTKWQREIIYDFIIDYCKEVTRKNG